MVKITAKTIAKVINRSPKYVYLMLSRRKITLKNINYEELLLFIAENIHKKYFRNAKIVNLRHKKYKGIKGRVDKECFSRLYQNVKKYYNNSCKNCGGKGEHIHHLDFIHGNMDFSNMVLLCQKCHWNIHVKKITPLMLYPPKI